MDSYTLGAAAVKKRKEKRGSETDRRLPALHPTGPAEPITPHILLTAKSIRHAFDGVPPVANVHDGHARHLADAALEVTVTRCNNVAFVLRACAKKRERKILNG